MKSGQGETIQVDFGDGDVFELRGMTLERFRKAMKKHPNPPLMLDGKWGRFEVNAAAIRGVEQVADD